MRFHHLLALLPAGVGLGLALASCTSGTVGAVVSCGPDNVATTTYDVATVTNFEAGFYWAAADPIATGLYTFDVIRDAPQATSQAVSAASAAAAAVGSYYSSGCATASANQNVVTYTLDNCSGPLALISTSGTFTATFTATGNGSIQIALAGTNINADGGVLMLQTSASVTLNASGQRTLSASSQTTGTGPDGNSINHTGTYTLVWPTGAGCGTLNATLSNVGSGIYAGTTTTITNYVVCRETCPQSGTVKSSFNGGNVTLTYNGSNSASCTSSLGTASFVPLNCP
jgi:hypothetical protein